MRSSSAAVIVVFSFLLGVALVFTLMFKVGSPLNDYYRMWTDQSDYQILWDKDGLEISTGMMSGTLYGTKNGTPDTGIVFASIKDGNRAPINVMATGDVMMHVDFVNKNYIGINVTDSVGRRPVAFVVNRQSQQIETIESTTAGEYLAGANDGQRMLMLKGKMLSSANLDKSILRNFPALKVNIPTLVEDFQPWDAAFSPDDVYIVVAGTGYVEGTDSRDGERNVFWVLDMDNESATQIGQINADIIEWEDNDTFSLLSGNDQQIIARYSLKNGGWIKE